MAQQAMKGTEWEGIVKNASTSEKSQDKDFESLGWMKDYNKILEKYENPSPEQLIKITEQKIKALQVLREVESQFPPEAKKLYEMLLNL